MWDVTFAFASKMWDVTFAFATFAFASKMWDVTFAFAAKCGMSHLGLCHLCLCHLCLCVAAFGCVVGFVVAIALAWANYYNDTARLLFIVAALASAYGARRLFQAATPKG